MSDITIKNGECSAVINYHGAELKSLKKNGREYMWCADPEFWGRTAPVLFPFVGAVNNGVFTYKGVDYPMGQHGFARDMDFELELANDTEVRFVLNSNDETLAKYPMPFQFISGYRIEMNKLYVDWEVVNTGDEPLQFSIGAHPAFACILDDTSLVFKKKGMVIGSFANSVFGKGLLTDEKKTISLDDGCMKLDAHSFDGDAYVIENNQVDEIVVLDKNSEEVMSVCFDSPLVGVWSPPGKNAPFLCIEPWYGRADKEGFVGEISTREWNNTLAPGEVFKANYSICLK